MLFGLTAECGLCGSDFWDIQMLSASVFGASDETGVADSAAADSGSDWSRLGNVRSRYRFQFLYRRADGFGRSAGNRA